MACSCMQGQMFASTMARAAPYIACTEDSLSPGSSGQSIPLKTAVGISCVLMLGLCAPSYSFITQEQHHHQQQDTRVPAPQFPDLIHF